MICKHCGTQNPDNTRICKQCGMPLEESTAQNPVKQEESKNKTSKNVMKKKSLLLIIGSPLLAYVIGQAAGKKLGENMSGGSNSSTPVETSVEDDTQKEDNPEYTKIFTDRGIIKPSYIVLGKSTASYAKVEVNEYDMESIDCYDVAYDKASGVISSMISSQYLDISSYTEEQVEIFETTVQEEVNDIQGENCTVTIENRHPYYYLSIEYKNLDDENVMNSFIEQGALETTGVGNGGLFGITPTEEGFLSDGYIKK